MNSLKGLEDILILISTSYMIIVIAFIIQLIANLIIIFSIRKNLKEIKEHIIPKEKSFNNEEIDDTIKNNIIIKVSIIISAFCLLLIILMSLPI